MPPRYNDLVEDEDETMLEATIIVPIPSALSFALMITTKNNENPMFCVEYHALNELTRADRLSLLKIEDILDELEGARSSQSAICSRDTGKWK